MAEPKGLGTVMESTGLETSRGTSLPGTSGKDGAKETGASAKETDASKEEEDYDEEEDDDYDPESKPEPAEASSEDEEDNADYSAIGLATTQVRTRNQRYQERHQEKTDYTRNIVRPVSGNFDFNSIFNELKQKSNEGKPTNWNEILDESEIKPAEEPVKPQPVPENTDQADGEEKIWINTSYAFAGKVVTESKLVDANSAEAKAYLNSTSGLQLKNGTDAKEHRSFVPVIRTVEGYDEPLELKIKLKRPSLIDKFLMTLGNKYQKLSTLEKSRLDWASYVDTNKINDELRLHNKDGYLEKQDFLGRLQVKQDENYEKAREADRIKRWQEQNKT